MGRSVVMVDIDPQCNLTGMALEVTGDDLFPDTYQGYEKTNIYSTLRPVLKSTGEKISAPECVRVAGNTYLRILPGSVKLAEVETQLATAMSVGSTLPAIQNIPGSFSHIYDRISEKYDADYILLDMSPSLGAINQINLLNADYFIMPTMPDVFSVMAVTSLSDVIPDWMKWAQRVGQWGLFQDDDILYEFSPKRPKFLGTVVQNYNIRKGLPSKAFQQYFDQLDQAITEKLMPALDDVGLLLSEDKYEGGHALAKIQSFNSLIATSQEKRKPVFTLSNRELITYGAANATQHEKVEHFDEIFRNFAESVEARMR